MIVIKSKQSTSTSRTTLCLLIQIISYFIYMMIQNISIVCGCVIINICAHVFLLLASYILKNVISTPNIILFFLLPNYYTRPFVMLCVVRTLHTPLDDHTNSRESTKMEQVNRIFIVFLIHYMLYWMMTDRNKRN